MSVFCAYSNSYQYLQSIKLITHNNRIEIQLSLKIFKTRLKNQY